MRHKGQIFDLKRFRLERNLSQTEIASAVDLPQSFISAIENGKRPASKSLLDKLRSIYKVDDLKDYMSDPEKPQTQIMRNIRNSMINSPGGVFLPMEVAKKLSKSELVDLVSHKENSEVTTPPSPFPTEAATTLLNLLASAEERYLRERKKVEELEEENALLKRELQKYKK